MENREIENFYTRDDVKIFSTVYENPEYNQNTMPLKHPFRALLIAQTGGGKTNLLLDIINKCKCFQLIKLFGFGYPCRVGLKVLKSRSLQLTVRMEANCIPLAIKIIVPVG